MAALLGHSALTALTLDGGAFVAALHEFISKRGQGRVRLGLSVLITLVRYDETSREPGS